MKPSIGFLTALLLVSCSHSGSKPQAEAAGRALELEEGALTVEADTATGRARLTVSAGSAEPIRSLVVRDPDGKKVAELKGKDLKSFGLGEIEIETPAAALEELEAAFPEGVYTLSGRTAGGERFFGEAELTYDLLPAPEFQPAGGEEVDPAHVLIEWSAVAGAVSYRVEVVQEDLEIEVAAELGSEDLSFSLPDEVVRPGVEYAIQVAAVSESGNVSFTTSTFVTRLESELPSRCPGAFSERFFPEDCGFENAGRNSFFILEPGYRLVLEGEEDGAEIAVEITVLDETETVAGVETRVVEEREWEDGELKEVSRNFFALCRETGDLYYFGEDVDIYEDGEVVSHEGAWRAGVDGARPGVLVPGSPMLGARAFQEIAPDVAMDRGEVIAIFPELEVTAGTFDDVLFIFETTPLEPSAESFKYYAAGVGLIRDDELELVEYGFVEGGDE